ncbi:MAG: hypothetical protein ACRECY_01735 [Phyllobacterium sp.]
MARRSREALTVHFWCSAKIYHLRENFRPDRDIFIGLNMFLFKNLSIQEKNIPAAQSQYGNIWAFSAADLRYVKRVNCRRQTMGLTRSMNVLMICAAFAFIGAMVVGLIP